MAKSAVKQARIFERSQAYRDNYDAIFGKEKHAEQEGKSYTEELLPAICEVCGKRCHSNRPKNGREVSHRAEGVVSES